jgi:hypothetical protein
MVILLRLTKAYTASRRGVSPLWGHGVARPEMFGLRPTRDNADTGRSKSSTPQILFLIFLLIEVCGAVADAEATTGFDFKAWHSQLFYLPVAWEESQRWSAADFPEADFWGVRLDFSMITPY